jgi:hypothetical protein
MVIRSILLARGLKFIATGALGATALLGAAPAADAATAPSGPVRAGSDAMVTAEVSALAPGGATPREPWCSPVT